jgi:hypothetical protein
VTREEAREKARIAAEDQSRADAMERQRIARYLTTPRVFNTEPEVKLPPLIEQSPFEAEMQREDPAWWSDWRVTLTYKGKRYRETTMTRWGAIWWAHRKKAELLKKEQHKESKPVRINL